MVSRFDTPCVYLLESLKCRRLYIGYSNDPFHRLRQHNQEICGGAKYTGKHGPWRLYAIAFGFVDSGSALRFEWALQHPHRSKWLRGMVEYHRCEIRSRAALMEKLAEMWPDDVEVEIL